MSGDLFRKSVEDVSELHLGNTWSFSVVGSNFDLERPRLFGYHSFIQLAFANAFPHNSVNDSLDLLNSELWLTIVLKSLRNNLKRRLVNGTLKPVWHPVRS